jgi:hypothetical protein
MFPNGILQLIRPERSTWMSSGVSERLGISDVRTRFALTNDASRRHRPIALDRRQSPVLYCLRRESSCRQRFVHPVELIRSTDFQSVRAQSRRISSAHGLKIRAPAPPSYRRMGFPSDCSQAQHRLAGMGNHPARPAHDPTNRPSPASPHHPPISYNEHPHRDGRSLHITVNRSCSFRRPNEGVRHIFRSLTALRSRPSGRKMSQTPTCEQLRRSGSRLTQIGIKSCTIRCRQAGA